MLGFISAISKPGTIRAVRDVDAALYTFYGFIYFRLQKYMKDCFIMWNLTIHDVVLCYGMVLLLLVFAMLM